ncbi:hypothetical protein TURU_157605 [Turdus rufiventris]|nr:hypothetical protein TURU_157605 [Turdus rufiventris]
MLESSLGLCCLPQDPVPCAIAGEWIHPHCPALAAAALSLLWNSTGDTLGPTAHGQEQPGQTPGLGWTGLGWTGLGWTGLSWIGLG